MLDFPGKPILKRVLRFGYHRLWQGWQVITGHRRLKRVATEKLGYQVNLVSPRSFNEKVLWKKFHDRNPLLPLTADKVRVRDYVAEKLGAALAADIMIPLLACATRPKDIDFARLPARYVIKANHACGTNLIVRDDSLTHDQIRARAAAWLENDFGWDMFEWAYRPIKRMILVEQLIEDQTGRPPDDYKFFMFHGRCRLIRHIGDRFSDHSTTTTYSPDWQYLGVARGHWALGSPVERPVNLDRMLQIAEQLSEDFDFVRVDLYSVDNRVYFGELTHYPASGTSPFRPQSFDFELGAHWHIREKYWLKTREPTPSESTSAASTKP